MMQRRNIPDRAKTNSQQKRVNNSEIQPKLPREKNEKTQI